MKIAKIEPIPIFYLIEDNFGGSLQARLTRHEVIFFLYKQIFLNKQMLIGSKFDCDLVFQAAAQILISCKLHQKTYIIELQKTRDCDGQLFLHFWLPSL